MSGLKEQMGTICRERVNLQLLERVKVIAYLAAFTGECSKVNTIRNVIADSTHVLTLVQLNMHWLHYRKQSAYIALLNHTRSRQENSMVDRPEQMSKQTTWVF